MKKLLFGLLFPLLAYANPPIVWGPNNQVQLLQPGILFAPGISSISSGTADPTVTAQTGNKASVYLSSVTGSLYKKTDTGSSTNWQNIGATGTVTNIGLIGSNIFSISGSPVTSAGTFNVSLANQTANTVFAGATSGGTAIPSFRSLVAADIPSLDATKVTTGTISVPRGGTGAGTFTTGSLIFANTTGTAALVQDNAKLFWDDVNFRLGVGTSSPTSDIQTVGRITAGTFAGNGSLLNSVNAGSINAGTLGVPFGGTGAGTFVAGSLIFANTAGTAALTQNNAKLFWDNTNLRLGIGTSSPTSDLQTLGRITSGTFAGNGSLITGLNAGSINAGLLGVPFGGTNIGTFTSGSIIFANTTGTAALVQDNAKLFWDDVNFRLGIGTASPSSDLQTAGRITAGTFAAAGTGAAGTPTFTISGNANTGWFSPASSQMGVSTNGTERLRIDASGNVGIGNSLPGAILHVTSVTDQLRLGYNANNYLNFTVDSAANGSISSSSGSGAILTYNMDFAAVQGFRTNATQTNSNLWVSSGISGSTTSSSFFQLVTSSTLGLRIGERGSTNYPLPVGGAYASHIIAQQTVTEASAGNHPLLSQFAVRPLSVTAGTATVSDTATVYIEDAANAVTSGTNYALWVDAGANRFDGVVSVGTAIPHASALVDVASSTQGFLPPRMTTTAKNAIPSPAAGLTLFDSTLTQLTYYSGSAWVALSAGNSAGTINLVTFLSGSGTYTPTSGLKYARVRIAGGGAGGAGGGTSGNTNGAAGGNTTFGATLTANGGAAGRVGNDEGGAGGTCTVSSPAVQVLAITGGQGEGGQSNGTTGATTKGGRGGDNLLGGAGAAPPAGLSDGHNGVTNTGGGGSGGSTNGTSSDNSGSGGGAGCYIEALFSAPVTSAVTVGTGGTGGVAGGNGNKGGNGASGVVIIEEGF